MRVVTRLLSIVMIATMAVAVGTSSATANSTSGKAVSTRAACKLELKRLGKKKFTARYAAKHSVARSLRKCIAAKLRAKKVEQPSAPSPEPTTSSRTVVPNPTDTSSSSPTSSSTPPIDNGANITPAATNATPESSERLCTRETFYYRGTKGSSCVIKFNHPEGSETQLARLGERLGSTPIVTNSTDSGSGTVITFYVAEGLSETQYTTMAGDSSVAYLEPNSIVTV